MLGAAKGSDCAAFCIKGKNTAWAMNPVCIETRDVAWYAVHEAVNTLIAGGGEPYGIEVSAFLPEDITEEEIRDLADQVHEACEMLGIEACGGHTEITDAVSRPILTVSALGEYIAAGGEGDGTEIGAKATDTNRSVLKDLLMTGHAGMAGAAILAQSHREALLKRLPASFLERADAFRTEASIAKAAKAAREAGECRLHDIGQGGIFGALWELGEQLQCGMEVDLERIPIRQETIEICEILDRNPYELYAAGAMLIAAADGPGCVAALKKAGIECEIIGRLTDHKERVLLADEKRYLTPPQGDSIFR